MKNYSFKSVNYKFNRKARKWEFVSGNYTLFQACSGQDQAHLIARQVQGAVARSKNPDALISNGIDNLARKTITNIID